MEKWRQAQRFELFHSFQAPAFVTGRQIHDSIKIFTQSFDNGKADAFIRTCYLKSLRMFVILVENKC